MRYHGQKEVIVMTYTACTLCPRRCGVNRAVGQLGFCRQGAQLRAARAAAHFWEEPCISGHWGSGAVFFSGCTLRCVYCQNHSISSGGAGQPLTAGQLRRVFEQLIDQGVHNINLVTPTQFLPDILPALEPKLPVPVIMNSGGYESVPTLRALEGLVDIYLPDFKYADPALGARLSSAGDYPATALAAIREMARQTGPAQYDDDGMLLRGTLVRHLVLPGCVDNSLCAMELLAKIPDIQVSLLRQYAPPEGLTLPAPLDRRVTDDEYAGVLSWAELCGTPVAYTQGADSADGSFTPAFDGTGLDCFT